MKKKMVLSVVCLIALSAFGQSNDQDLLRNINWKEDSTEITTVNDIIKMQQDVTNKNYMGTHFRKVWSRKSYWNLSYYRGATTLTQDLVKPTGIGDIKSMWGISIQKGRSYALHKMPIANMVQFYLDWTYADLNFNYFKEKEEYNIYDYPPEFEASLGMALGPSVSIAPFTTTNLRGLHYMKLNVYYHIGYHLSLLGIREGEGVDSDIWGLGHGFTHSFGGSLMWKGIGLGYEYRSAAVEHQVPFFSNLDNHDKFKLGTKRLFIQVRM